MISKQGVQQLIGEVDGDVGVVVRDLQSDAGFAINAEMKFRAASLIKLPMFWSFYDRCNSGQLDPDELTTIADSDVTRGFGVLRTFQPGLQLRLRDLATLMVIVSDNTATNILIDRLGMSAINNDMQSLGLTETLLQRKMGDYDNPADNITSPADVEKILVALLQTSDWPDEISNEIAMTLHGQQCRNKLRWHIPEDVALAHKTGDLPGVEHDAGILTINERRTLIVVMTQKLQSNAQGEGLCRKIGKMVYENLNV